MLKKKYIQPKPEIAFILESSKTKVPFLNNWHHIFRSFSTCTIIRLINFNFFYHHFIISINCGPLFMQFLSSGKLFLFIYNSLMKMLKHPKNYFKSNSQQFQIFISLIMILFLLKFRIYQADSFKIQTENFHCVQDFKHQTVLIRIYQLISAIIRSTLVTFN